MPQKSQVISAPLGGPPTLDPSATGASRIEAKAGARARVSDQSGAQRNTILVVGANGSGRVIFRNLLELFGYEVLHTVDGMEGLKLARQHHPDLILIDTELPLVSGLEVARWDKEDDELSTIPIIAVADAPAERDEEIVLEVGCEALILESISSSQFQLAISSIFDQTPGR